MTNRTYQANENTYSSLKDFIENKITDFNAMAAPEADTWNRMQQDLSQWIDSDGANPDPIKDEVWIEFGQPRPELITSISEDDAGSEVVEVKENPLQKVISEFRAALLKEEDPVLINANEVLAQAFQNLPDTEEREAIEAELKNLQAEIREKRRAIAKEKVAQSTKAKSSDETCKLLAEARDWNPGDAAFARDIESRLRKAGAGMDKDSVNFRLNDLRNHEEFEIFKSSLYLLESQAGRYPFTPDQRSQIEQARAWYDRKRINDGVRTSVLAIGDLRQKYIEKIKLEQKPEQFYEHKGKKLTLSEMNVLLNQEYRIASQTTATDQIKKAQALKFSSPAVALAHLERILAEEEKIDLGNNEPQTIKRFPFYIDDENRIRNEISSYAGDVEKEARAKEKERLGNEESDGYQKLIYLIQSRDIYRMPGIDNKIFATQEPAKTARLNRLRGICAEIKADLDKVVHQDLSSAESLLSEIHAKKQSLATLLGESWPGAGVALDCREEGRQWRTTLQKPAEITEYDNELNGINQQAAQYQSAIKYLKERAGEITAYLQAGDEASRRQAIEVFNGLKRQPSIPDFRAFKDLEEKIIQLMDVDGDIRDIREKVENHQWAAAIAHCQQAQKKPAYQTASKDVRNEIQICLDQAKREYHLAELKRCLQEKNYKGVAFEIDWLKKIDSQNERILQDGKIVEQVRETGEPLVRLFNQAINDLGLQDDAPLVIVFSSINDLRERFIGNSMTDLQKKQFVALLDDKQEYLITKQYEDTLRQVVQNQTFENKVGALKKLKYIAGEIEKVDSNWPEFRDSMVMFDARRIADQLTNIIKQEILAYIRTTDPQMCNYFEAEFHLEAYYVCKMTGDAEADKLVRTFDIDLADTRDEILSPTDHDFSQRYRLWQKQVNRYASFEKVTGRWDEVRKEWTRRQVNKLMTQREYSEAWRILEDAIRDLGESPELLTLKIEICTEISCPEVFSIDEAKRALLILREFIKDEIRLIDYETQIKIAETLFMYQGKPIQQLEHLVELSSQTNLNRDRMINEINQRFDSLLKKKALEIDELVGVNDFERAVSELVDLIRIETIYSNVKDQFNHLSDKYFRNGNLIIWLFTGGLKILTDAGKAVRQYNQPDANLHKLQGTISLVEENLSRISAFNNVIQSRAGADAQELNLSQIIINLVRTSDQIRSQGAVLALLQDQIDQNSDSIFQDYLTSQHQLESALQRLRSFSAQYKAVSQMSLWQQCANDAMEGKPNPWDDLHTRIAPFQDTHCNYQEIRSLQNALGVWETQIGKASANYASLRAQVSAEQFELAGETLKSLWDGIKNLPEYDETDAHQKIKVELLSKVVVLNEYTTTNYIGVEEIKKQLTAWQAEINLWKGAIARIDGVLEELQASNQRFKNEYDAYWAKLQPNEGGRLLQEKSDQREYHAAVQRLTIGSTTAQTFVFNFSSPTETPEPAPQPVTPVAQVGVVGKFKELLGLRNGQPGQISPYVLVLRRDFSGFRAHDQWNWLDANQKKCSIEQNWTGSEKFNSQAACDLNQQYSQKRTSLSEMKEQYSDCASLVNLLLNKHPIPSRDELEKDVKANRVIPATKKVCDVDPYQTAEHIENFREICIHKLMA